MKTGAIPALISSGKNYEKLENRISHIQQICAEVLQGEGSQLLLLSLFGGGITQDLTMAPPGVVH